MLFGPENQLTSWLAISLIMLTSSLLLFHMTGSNTLIMHPYVAATLVSIFIILDICITITALIPYNLRSNEIFNEDSPEFKDSLDLGYNLKHERVYTRVYTVIICIFILIQLVVCVYVVKDSFERAKK